MILCVWAPFPQLACVTITVVLMCTTFSKGGWGDVPIDMIKPSFEQTHGSERFLHRTRAIWLVRLASIDLGTRLLWSSQKA